VKDLEEKQRREEQVEREQQRLKEQKEKQEQQDRLIRQEQEEIDILKQQLIDLEQRKEQQRRMKKDQIQEQKILQEAELLRYQALMRKEEQQQELLRLKELLQVQKYDRELSLIRPRIAQDGLQHHYTKKRDQLEESERLLQIQQLTLKHKLLQNELSKQKLAREATSENEVILQEKQLPIITHDKKRDFVSRNKLDRRQQLLLNKLAMEQEQQRPQQRELHHQRELSIEVVQTDDDEDLEFYREQDIQMAHVESGTQSPLTTVSGHSSPMSSKYGHHPADVVVPPGYMLVPIAQTIQDSNDPAQVFKETPGSETASDLTITNSNNLKQVKFHNNMRPDLGDSFLLSVNNMNHKPTKSKVKLPDDGNLYKLSTKSFMEILTYLKLDDDVLTACRKNKLDGKEFSRLSEKEMIERGLVHPILYHFKRLTGKKRNFML
jgi:hypothetical protein